MPSISRWRKWWFIVSEVVTFPQLNEALAGLGFQKITADEFTVYRNAAFDAMLILPREGVLPHPLPMHVAAARATVAGKGVATAAEFDRRLLQAIRQGGATISNGHRPAARTGKKAKKREAPAQSPGAEVLTPARLS